MGNSTNDNTNNVVMVSENMYESVDNLSSVTEGEEAEADKENVEQEKPKQERQEESLVKMRKKLKSRWAKMSKIQMILWKYFVQIRLRIRSTQAQLHSLQQNNDRLL